MEAYEIIYPISISGLIVIFIWLQYKNRKQKTSLDLLTPLGMAVKEIHKDLTEEMEKLGEHVKKSFRSQINSMMGKATELQAILSLKEKYVRFIPLGQPIDSIGIAKDRIDFIEVKSGNAALTTEEKLIEYLVKAKKVNFVLMRVNAETKQKIEANKENGER
jgi:predicted Holliday junction resolvase-like endonuclease